MELNQETVADWRGAEEQPKQEKTKSQKCFDEMQPILQKYNCQIICVPQKMYGQTVYVPMIEEIK